MSWVYLSDSQPKARKRYRCCLCNYHIEMGEKHTARRGIGDDGPVTFRMHDECIEQTEDWTDEEWEYTLPGDMPPPERLRAVPS